ncbi:MAG TPA: cobalt chelatase [Methanotrichaceae archaeon]|nr:cobalt chelatase [Methanotrichaceae archaeon]
MGKVSLFMIVFATLMIAPFCSAMDRNVKEENAILLVAFGTSYPEAQASFDSIEAIYEEEFPNAEIRMAFTSDFIRQKIADRDGIFIDNPVTAIAKLNDEGYVKVVVQSLHVIPGEEFHDLANIVDSFNSIDGKFAFQNLVMGMPLLTRMEDYQATSIALASQFDKTTDEKGNAQGRPRDPKDTAVALMGHGTKHSANSAYSQMALILKEDYENVFLGTVEGYPAYEDVLEGVSSSGTTSVRMMPFMIVAGDHANNDLYGDEDDSWKVMLEGEGFDTEPYLKGMGENNEIVKIFVEHTKAALEELET